ncbi:uncharacterized protein LOC143228145 [Tachypleus tridentatus]|uniref:uncharacterized protein LOC143228145 n=1 Tax=Tachypleus tridentatus TaxID=6853 RepID=UPI003FD1F92F
MRLNIWSDVVIVVVLLQTLHLAIGLSGTSSGFEETYTWTYVDDKVDPNVLIRETLKDANDNIEQSFSPIFEEPLIEITSYKPGAPTNPHIFLDTSLFNKPGDVGHHSLPGYRLNRKSTGKGNRYHYGYSSYHHTSGDNSRFSLYELRAFPYTNLTRKASYVHKYLLF